MIKNVHRAFMPGKKTLLFVFFVVFSAAAGFAQESTTAHTGREIANLLSAVQAANPGDFILLPSGRRYVLTRAEIAIARGEFEYENLSEIAAEIRADGTEIRTISQAHTAYVHPDGQATHILKTRISFTAFMRHIERTFFVAHYIDWLEDVHEYMIIDPPDFSVFRASVQYQTLSDGIEEVQAVNIIMYNLDGENLYMRYTSVPDMVWGNISDRGVYSPVGESHVIEFELE